jgi:acyloxyacyl hydrolase
MMNDTTFSDLLTVAAMEVDWPHMSGYTGFVNNTMVDSIYLRMRERNLCNHRDFQNTGVNGARAEAVAPPNGIVNSVSRDQQLDNPALLFLSLIGNDVCSPHSDFENTMTTPQSFAQSTLETLQYLDTILPNNSHVVFIGLANGSLLWDVLNFRLHPIGVTYADLYSYLICMDETPCT